MDERSFDLLSKPVVYIGPSLPLSIARSILDATYYPPIRRGDIEKLECGSRIVIIDGEFAQALPVSPKEIIRCIDRGCKVFGASSMGALRAAELSIYGMIGIGWIYEAYRSGQVTCDDEVAVTISPFDQSAATIPLINVRWWLITLVERGLINMEEFDAGLRSARSIFFADRTAPDLKKKLSKVLGSSRYESLLALDGGQIPDRKAKDAILALEYIKNLVFRGK